MEAIRPSHNFDFYEPQLLAWIDNAIPGLIRINEGEREEKSTKEPMGKLEIEHPIAVPNSLFRNLSLYAIAALHKLLVKKDCLWLHTENDLEGSWAQKINMFNAVLIRSLQEAHEEIEEIEPEETSLSPERYHDERRNLVRRLRDTPELEGETFVWTLCGPRGESREWRILSMTESIQELHQNPQADEEIVDLETDIDDEGVE